MLTRFNALLTKWKTGVTRYERAQEKRELKKKLFLVFSQGIKSGKKANGPYLPNKIEYNDINYAKVMFVSGC